LLGLKTPALRARQPLFTETGTIHLVVPAGLKVSTLAELSSAAVRRLGRWPRTLAALVAVGVYAALGGGGPAAIRAAVMGALLALAPALGRAYNIYTALALAVLLMTVLEPALLYDAGFQLTALATAGLPLLTPRIARRLVVWLRWLPFSAVIAELLAVTLAAQIATLPVLALTFHIISFVAPLANLLTVPLLAPLLVLGALVATVGAVGGPLAGTLGLALAWVVWPLLAFVNGAIALCAALPGAFVMVGDMPAVLAALYYALLVGAVWRLGPLLRRRRARARSLAPGPHRFPGPALSTSMERAHGGTTHVRLSRGALAAVLGLALLGAGGAAAPALASAGTARLSFLDVGAGGEASLLRLPSGVTVLINGGPDGPALEAALAGRLPFWQRSLDLALLTDPRGGDVRGLVDAAAHFAIVRGADAGMAHPSADDLAWLDALRRAGALHTTVREGAVIHLAADTVLRVLAPPQSLFPPGEGTTTASNDAILRLETPGLRVLFLGTADDYALDALAYSGEPLGADVVEMALPTGAPLDLGGPLGTVLRQAHPRLIVVGSAPVSPTAQAALAAADADTAGIDAEVASTLGTLVYRIATAGTIELSGGAGGWSLGG
jgi:competence protein ComEC